MTAMICVDPLVDNGWIVRGKRVPNCHMISDNADRRELMEFAQRLGLKEHWFQNHPLLPHFDLTPAMRAKAIKAGAREITRSEIAKLMRRHRL